MEIEGPIGIATADIYLHFPCITKDEADELDDFLEEEHIEYEGATDVIIDLQNKVKKYKETIEKAIKYVNDNVYEENNGCGCYWWEITSKNELLEILEGGSNESRTRNTI